MPYELKETPETVQLRVRAPDRGELFRDTLAGVLAASYPTPFPEGTTAGQVVPIQAAGSNDDVLLARLVEEALRAVRDEPGTLLPPRWLAFDVDRVTANLPLHPQKSSARRLEGCSTRVESGEKEWTARLEFLPGTTV